MDASVASLLSGSLSHSEATELLLQLRMRERAKEHPKEDSAAAMLARQSAQKKEALERYSTLKKELQQLFHGQASAHDPTAGGYFFAPHGMCPAEIVLKMVDSLHNQVAASDKTIATLEDELKRYPYIAGSLHPMIVVQSNVAVSGTRAVDKHIEARNGIIRKIANSMADRRIAQEALDFWRTVPIATEEYMEEIKQKFMEKAELQRQLLAIYGIAEPSW